MAILKILKTKSTTLSDSLFLCQNILPTLLNIYAKFCGNPSGGFRYK